MTAIVGDVNNVMEKLAVIESEILNPLTSKALVTYENVPYTISAADMPLFVNYAGKLIKSTVAGEDGEARTFNDIREYILKFYHSPFGTGVEGEKMGLLTPFFALVYDAFSKYPHLKMGGGVMDAIITNDTGMSIITFGGQQYYGVQFVLRVTTKTRRVLGEYE